MGSKNFGVMCPVARDGMIEKSYFEKHEMRHEMSLSVCTVCQFVTSNFAKIGENGDRRFRIDSSETHLQVCICVQAYSERVCKCLL